MKPGPVQHGLGLTGDDVDDFAVVAAVDGVLGFHALPGAGALLLEAKGNLFLLLVHGNDEYFELLVDVHHLVRVGDPAPTHVGDVQQAVNAPQIDEGAKLGNVLDNSLADLPGSISESSRFFISSR